ncbi:MAG: DUF2085 domain-containing protein [Rhizonema sp. PD38]|nr:DUF2085 domain-containing protein [Rhizonema sp. PD38]
MTGIAFRRRSKIPWVSAIADFILAGMVLGPLAAPILAALRLPMFPLIADIIYFMGHYVCPQPDMGVTLAPPYIMAVCMRCYGTVTGLLITRLLYGVTNGNGFYWLTQYGWGGAVLTSFLMMAYPIELAAEVLNWWSFNNYLVFAFGLITGLAWGLFTMPILHEKKLKRSLIF